ncbi:hypothetical protein AAEX28_15945 [Lentisphaerota bacterium WC36G]|nr:hypothetical protein LJT99_02705 [Lentisphaerae bacterium WC36]
MNNISIKALVILLLIFPTVFIINGIAEKNTESKLKKKIISLGRYKWVNSEKNDIENLAKLVSLLNQADSMYIYHFKYPRQGDYNENVVDNEKINKQVVSATIKLDQKETKKFAKLFSKLDSYDTLSILGCHFFYFGAEFYKKNELLVTFQYSIMGNQIIFYSKDYIFNGVLSDDITTSMLINYHNWLETYMSDLYLNKNNFVDTTVEK